MQSVSSESWPVRTRRAQISVTDWRPDNAVPGGPDLVLLHEGLGCTAMWKRFPEALAVATGCRVLSYDRQGYGQSDPFDSPRDFDYLNLYAEEELPDVLEAVGLSAPVLIGHSDGGTIALLFANRFPTRALVTMAAHIFVEDVTLAGLRHAARIWAETDWAERLARYHGAKTDVVFHAWVDTWLSPGFTDWNIEASLSGVTAPALIIQGEDDEYGSVEQVNGICRQVSGPATPLIMRDCGHSPHIQACDRTVEAIAGFLRDL